MYNIQFSDTDVDRIIINIEQCYNELILTFSLIESRAWDVWLAPKMLTKVASKKESLDLVRGLIVSVMCWTAGRRIGG